ncbi:pilus assembly protein TadG-related protein [Falsiroseomonas bella]|nr:pilus assembly protein TadG-related protein [Falsiroseomonas bella]
MAFAGTAVVLFGAVAIAADAGVWYSARRGAQNAADVAAAAAATSLAMSGAAPARTAGLDVAARNGFPNLAPTSVAVNIPPSSGANSTNPSAVEVIVRQQQSLGAAGFFLSAAPTVQGRSVASLRDASNVCVLALTGTLSFGGNSVVDAPNCVLASNRRSLAGVETNGNSFDVIAFSLSTVGSCPNCTSSRFQLTQRAAEWQVPVENPFAHLDAKLLPIFNAGTCLDPGNNPTSLAPYETNGRRAYCDDIRLSGNRTLTLSPGTYYLNNASLSLQGGTLRCPTCTGDSGVTIVLTGSPGSIGDITINGNANVENLRAPNAPADPDFRGVLLFRDGRATNTGSNGNPPVRINGGANLTLMGGMYFPNAHSRFNGTAGTALCGVLVGASFEFTGNAGVARCGEVGTRVPQTRIVVVAE